MGKKRKVSRGVPASGPREFEVADGRLGYVRTWQDVANDEDKHEMEQDRIMFDDDGQYSNKRARSGAK